MIYYSLGGMRSNNKHPQKYKYKKKYWNWSRRATAAPGSDNNVTESRIPEARGRLARRHRSQVSVPISKPAPSVERMKLVRWRMSSRA